MRNLITVIIPSLFFLSGCSLFFGNIKPVEEKSKNYGIADLSLKNPDWTKLEGTQDLNGAPTSGIADVSFQSKKTASIISINSACKTYDNERKESLSALTHELLLGISEINYFKEKNFPLDGNNALQTTIKGKINNEDMQLRTVVVQRFNCVYDLMYISRPEKFGIDEEDFSHFVSSLKLK